MAKECTLDIDKLPRYCVVRIIDHPDMTSAVYHVLKATDLIH